jgi:hypothetical protein
MHAAQSPTLRLSALRAELLKLRDLGRATSNPALLQDQIERMSEVAVEVGLLDLPRAMHGPQEICRVCGEELGELYADNCHDSCNDDFPEPGDMDDELEEMRERAAGAEREMPELFDGQESDDELEEMRERAADRPAPEICTCCGEDMAPGQTFCCTDEFPEPGDIRETGR